MKDVAFLARLEQLGLTVFTVSDAARITGDSGAGLYVFLGRLAKRDLVTSVKNGMYALRDASPNVVATSLAQPSYISFLSGLQHHGRTTQMPVEIQVVSTASHRPLEYAGHRIRLVKLPPFRIFGFRRVSEPGGTWFVGDLEKVLADSLFLPRLCPVSECWLAMNDSVDAAKLMTYAERMGSYVTVKRAGYLLERLGYTVATSIKTNYKYEPLNPLLPLKGTRNRRWHLIINEVLEDA
ncbi:MAG: hypothetical protein Q7J68_06005 [Thermoplasmata archaeon]|nr:hypothetical protein [Thermoplasmata archaeon]